MDVTIHPVINFKVGDYASNQREHRVCEMHQDAYIYPRLKLGGVDLAEHLDSGIAACFDGAGGLDADVRALWLAALATAYPHDYRAQPPDLMRGTAGSRGFLIL